MKITVITTGGTIAKTYDEADGSLRPESQVVESIIGSLRLPDLEVQFRHVLAKDSLELTDADRHLIVDTVRAAINESEGVVIVHGTDTLSMTGEVLVRSLPNPKVGVILTGAMRPFEFRDSDAQQNVTEALLASRVVSPGIYAVMHNRVLQFPGVVKDRQQFSFKKTSNVVT